MRKNPLMSRIRTIHFIGIGGSGMSGIAEVLLNQGYNITGSDQHASLATAKLVSLGAKIFTKHEAENILGSDAVVVSSAISSDNPEVRAANEAHLPVLPRAQMLAELMRFHYGVAVAGTHGKTTTTSLLASILDEAKLDPTFVIGGILNHSSTSARLGSGEYFIVEADESDASFLYFNPMVSIVTNIDVDHTQAYDNSFDKLKEAFLDFLHRLPFYGLAVLCVDDPVVKEILPSVSRSVITYGFSEEADVRISDFKQKGFKSTGKVHWKQKGLSMDLQVNLPGRHNILNAVASAVVAMECCGVSEEVVNKALAKFGGVGRRMENFGKLAMPNGEVLLIDDYGHHPQEVLVTMEALRAACPERRLVLAFQPHRYTRLQDLFEDFVAVLSQADLLLLMDTYAASENSIFGIDSKTLVRSIRQRGKIEPIFVANNDDLFDLLPGVLAQDDILLIQGAGSIGAMAPKLKKEFGS